ncbi:unnamed protein product [Phytomonas sp. Hart1]|nr:unnamed protein product [Phytomonas sp. Hart1]|eukprot:CCW68457.1 unnamed protein product [Phytomonas sp. isolate Hart1]
MVLLGVDDGSVMSLSSSSCNDTEFASLSYNGTVVLWDTRLKTAMHTRIPNYDIGNNLDAGELLFLPEFDMAITLCGKLIQFFDIRRGTSSIESCRHSCEVVRFLAGDHPWSRMWTLIVDEKGHIFPLNQMNMCKSSMLQEFVFGKLVDVPENGFGSLSNYSSGLGFVTEGSAKKDYGKRSLFSLGMDGRGCLLRGPEPTQWRDFTLGNLELDKGSTMFNPPLANCCGFSENCQVAVGLADGTYIICEVTTQGEVEELMTAPGHATNGLCHVDFLPTGSLLTVSLCGQITVWDVPNFLLGDGDAEIDGELPMVQCALDHHVCTGMKRSVINCASMLGQEILLTGDANGNVVSNDLKN